MFCWGIDIAVSVKRIQTLFTDNEGHGLADPNGVIRTDILVENSNLTGVTGPTVAGTLNGLTLIPCSVKVTPTAFDDISAASPLPIQDNTPHIVSASALPGNNVDADHRLSETAFREQR
jgi:hypothetical protein